MMYSTPVPTAPSPGADANKHSISKARSPAIMEKKQLHEAKAQELGNRLGAFTAMLKEKEMTGIRSSSIKSAPDTLVRQLAEAEGRLNVTSKLADFLQNSLSQAEEDKRVGDVKAQSLVVEIDALRAQIKDQDDKIALREGKIKEMAGKIKALLKQMADTEAHLNSSYNDTLTSHHAGMEQAAKEKAALEAKIAELEFRTMEANRVLKFLQVSTTKLSQEKEMNEAEADRKIVDLQYHLASANRVAAFAQSSAIRLKEEKERNDKEAALEIASLQFRLTETNRIVKFLQNRLDAAKRQNDQNENVANGKIAELKNQLTQAGQMVKFLENRLSAIQSKSDKTIADLLFRATESDRVNKFLQNRLETTQNETGGKVADLEFRLTEAERMVKFMQTKLEGAGKDKGKVVSKVEDLEVELYALKCKLDDKDAELAARDQDSVAHNAEMQEMASQVHDLEGRLNVSNRVQEYLQSLLSRAEEEKLYSQYK